MYVVCGVGDRGGVNRNVVDKCMLCVVIVEGAAGIWRTSVSCEWCW